MPSPLFQITVGVGPSDIADIAGTVVIDSGDIAGPFPPGSFHTVDATPNINFAFVNWTRDDIIVGRFPSLTFALNDDVNLIANFKQIGPFQAPVVYTGDRHMRRTGDDYAFAMAHLLPQGIAWPREPDTILQRTVRGLSQIFGYVDRRAGDLLETESDPRTTIEMLSDWERNWGLPDYCFVGVGQNLAQRRYFLILKMTLEGGQSREWFIWVCNQLGYDVGITEFAPFMVGISRVGDTRGFDHANNLFVGNLIGSIP